MWWAFAAGWALCLAGMLWAVRCAVPFPDDRPDPSERPDLWKHHGAP